MKETTRGIKTQIQHQHVIKKEVMGKMGEEHFPPDVSIYCI
jgi:hypothetical protein